MSGHSKWASIKHKKAITDARRGQAWTKLANAVALAARGGADPEMNHRLRLAIAKAKAANMPNANIERSIKRGSGQLGGAQIEEIMYEGYGPAGVAILVEVATDNRNRTAAEVRSAFSKHGGRMGETGSVAYQFDQKGVINIKAVDSEQATLDAIEAGAEDIEDDQDELTIYTKSNQLDAVRKTLEDKGHRLAGVELQYIPSSTVRIEDAKTAGTVMRLMDALEDLDDVVAAHANFDIDSKVLEKI